MWDRLSREGAGSRFLAWIGGVVTLAGVVLLLVLAIQRGYVGPVPRLLLGAGLAAPSSVSGSCCTAPRPAASVRVRCSPWALPGAALAVTALAVAWAWVRTRASVRRLWIVAGCVALYGATAVMLAVGLAVSPDERGFLIGHVLVTLSWTVGALVLLLRHADSTPLRVAGLALVGGAVAKLVVFDLASLSGIPRVLAFLGAGLVLLADGAKYAKLAAPQRS